MPSNDFEREVNKMAELLFPVFYRWDDSSSNQQGNYFAQQKPFDCFGALRDGTFWTIESKRKKIKSEVKRAVSISANNIQEHQINALMSDYSLGMIAINFRGKVNEYHNIYGEYFSGSKTMSGMAFILGKEHWYELEQLRKENNASSYSNLWIRKECLLERLGKREGFDEPIWWPSQLSWLHQLRSNLSQFYMERMGYGNFQRDNLGTSL